MRAFVKSSLHHLLQAEITLPASRRALALFMNLTLLAWLVAAVTQSHHLAGLEEASLKLMSHAAGHDQSRSSAEHLVAQPRSYTLVTKPVDMQKCGILIQALWFPTRPRAGTVGVSGQCCTSANPCKVIFALRLWYCNSNFKAVQVEQAVPKNPRC